MRAPSILYFAAISFLAVSGPALGGELRGESHGGSATSLKDIPTRYGSMPGAGNIDAQARTDGTQANGAQASDTAVASRPASVVTGRSQPAQPPEVANVVERYGSLPGGVVLEGSATGLDSVTSMHYDTATRKLILGDNLSFKTETSMGDIAQLARALAEDDRVGISITSDNIITYGAVPEDTDLARNLTVADAFLVDFVVPPREWTKGYRMAGGYEPVSVDTDVEIVSFYRLHNFTFEVRDNQVVLADAKADIYVVPVTNERAQDGGYLPDLNALASSSATVVTEIKKNADHIAENINYYMGERAARRAVAYGQVAAILRHLKSKGVDLSALADQIEGDLPEAREVEWDSLAAAWTTYLREIQTAGDYANWSAPPLDLYLSRQGAHPKEAAAAIPQP